MREQAAFIKTGDADILQRAYLLTSDPREIADETVAHAVGNAIGLPMPPGFIVTATHPPRLWWGVNALIGHSCLRHCRDGRHAWARDRIVGWRHLVRGAVFDLLIGRQRRSKSALLFAGDDVFLIDNHGLSNSDAVDTPLLRIAMATIPGSGIGALRRAVSNAQRDMMDIAFNPAVFRADDELLMHGRQRWDEIVRRSARLPEILIASMELIGVPTNKNRHSDRHTASLV